MAKNAPGETLPPAVLTSVAPGSPAVRAGVRPGDVITAVNGAPPFTDGMVSLGAFYLLYPSYPQQQTVRITLRWPVTGATRTVTITPAAYPDPALMIIRNCSLIRGSYTDLHQRPLFRCLSAAGHERLPGACFNYEKARTPCTPPAGDRGWPRGRNR